MSVNNEMIADSENVNESNKDVKASKDYKIFFPENAGITYFYSGITRNDIEKLKKHHDYSSRQALYKDRPVYQKMRELNLKMSDLEFVILPDVVERKNPVSLNTRNNKSYGENAKVYQKAYRDNNKIEIEIKRREKVIEKAKNDIENLKKQQEENKESNEFIG